MFFCTNAFVESQSSEDVALFRTLNLFMEGAMYEKKVLKALIVTFNEMEEIWVFPKIGVPPNHPF